MNSELTTSDVGNRAMEIFENQIKDHVAGLDSNLFLAIDVDSGDFEVADEEFQEIDHLKARRQNAVAFLRRIGSNVTYFMGSGDVQPAMSVA